MAAAKALPDSRTDFYVYVHRRATDGTVFYVGKGKGRRAWSAKGRNIHWREVVDRCGFVAEIIASEMTNYAAYKKEAELIEEYGLDCLCNLVPGGAGGGVVTKEAARKISLRLRGRPTSQATKDGWRRWLTPEKNEERVRKMNEGRRRRILCVETGVIFDSFTSAVKWVRQTKNPRAANGNILFCCQGRRNHAYGYRWRYADQKSAKEP